MVNCFKHKNDHGYEMFNVADAITETVVGNINEINKERNEET